MLGWLPIWRFGAAGGPLVTGLTFEDEAKVRIEALYRAREISARRDEMLARLALSPGERVLDIGSGPGFFVETMAEAVGPAGHVRGVDISAPFVERAIGRRRHGWVSFAVGDATALPEPEAGHDVVTCVQVIEYVPDIAAASREIARVLRPGGRGLINVPDWGGLIWHSDDAARMARVCRAWEGHSAHPRLPRVLAPVLRGAGLSVDEVLVHQYAGLDWGPDHHPTHLAGFFRAYARDSGAVSLAEADAWYAELEDLAAAGRHFFSLPSFSFLISRPG